MAVVDEYVRRDVTKDKIYKWTHGVNTKSFYFWLIAALLLEGKRDICTLINNSFPPRLSIELSLVSVRIGAHVDEIVVIITF